MCARWAGGWGGSCACVRACGRVARVSVRRTRGGAAGVACLRRRGWLGLARPCSASCRCWGALASGRGARQVAGRAHPAGEAWRLSAHSMRVGQLTIFFVNACPIVLTTGEAHGIVTAWLLTKHIRAIAANTRTFAIGNTHACHTSSIRISARRAPLRSRVQSSRTLLAQRMR